MRHTPSPPVQLVRDLEAVRLSACCLRTSRVILQTHNTADARAQELLADTVQAEQDMQHTLAQTRALEAIIKTLNHTYHSNLQACDHAAASVHTYIGQRRAAANKNAPVLQFLHRAPPDLVRLCFSTHSLCAADVRACAAVCTAMRDVSRAALQAAPALLLRHAGSDHYTLAAPSLPHHTLPPAPAPHGCHGAVLALQHSKGGHAMMRISATGGHVLLPQAGNLCEEELPADQYATTLEITKLLTAKLDWNQPVLQHSECGVRQVAVSESTRDELVAGVPVLKDNQITETKTLPKARVRALHSMRHPLYGPEDSIDPVAGLRTAPRTSYALCGTTVVALHVASASPPDLHTGPLQTLAPGHSCCTVLPPDAPHPLPAAAPMRLNYHWSYTLHQGSLRNADHVQARDAHNPTCGKFFGLSKRPSRSSCRAILLPAAHDTVLALVAAHCQSKLVVTAPGFTRNLLLSLSHLTTQNWLVGQLKDMRRQQLVAASDWKTQAEAKLDRPRVKRLLQCAAATQPCTPQRLLATLQCLVPSLQKLPPDLQLYADVGLSSATTHDLRLCHTQATELFIDPNVCAPPMMLQRGAHHATALQLLKLADHGDACPARDSMLLAVQTATHLHFLRLPAPTWCQRALRWSLPTTPYRLEPAANLYDPCEYNLDFSVAAPHSDLLCPGAEHRTRREFAALMQLSKESLAQRQRGVVMLAQLSAWQPHYLRVLEGNRSIERSLRTTTDLLTQLAHAKTAATVSHDAGLLLAFHPDPTLPTATTVQVPLSELQSSTTLHWSHYTADIKLPTRQHTTRPRSVHPFRLTLQHLDANDSMCCL